MANLDDLSKLRRKLDDLQRESDRASGVLQQLLSQLKSEFGCDSLEAAQDLLQRKTQEVQTLERKFQQSLTNFKAKWGKELGL